MKNSLRHTRYVITSIPPSTHTPSLPFFGHLAGHFLDVGAFGFVYLAALQIKAERRERSDFKRLDKLLVVIFNHLWKKDTPVHQ